MKIQILLPLAAILLACPAWAASSSSGIALSTSALSFNGSSGDVTAQSLTIKSTGTASLVVNSLTTTNRAFAVSSSPLPITISAGKSLTIGIRAKPGTTVIQGTLDVTSNGGNPTVALSETAIAKQTTGHSVALTWQAPSGGTADSYQVDRAVYGSGSFSVIANTGASTSWTDSTVQNGVEYTYEVVAVDAAGVKSSPSNAFNVTIP